MSPDVAVWLKALSVDAWGFAVSSTGAFRIFDLLWKLCLCHAGCSAISYPRSHAGCKCPCVMLVVRPSAIPAPMPGANVPVSCWLFGHQLSPLPCRVQMSLCHAGCVCCCFVLESVHGHNNNNVICYVLCLQWEHIVHKVVCVLCCVCACICVHACGCGCMRLCCMCWILKTCPFKECVNA